MLHLIKSILLSTILAVLGSAAFFHLIAGLLAIGHVENFAHWRHFYFGAWDELDYHLISLFCIIPGSICGLLCGISLHLQFRRKNLSTS